MALALTADRVELEASVLTIERLKSAVPGSFAPRGCCPPCWTRSTSVQKWLGHAQLSTTVIYADAVGAEEKDIGARSGGARVGIHARALPQPPPASPLRGRARRRPMLGES
jgi:hypothetical protein